MTQQADGRLDLGSFLTAINKSKMNPWDTRPLEAEATYHPYIVNRLLSLHKDAIGLVNELNIRRLDRRHHFEVLLHGLPARSRFAKFPTPEREERVANLKRALSINEKRARELESLLTDEQHDQIAKELEEGGRGR